MTLNSCDKKTKPEEPAPVVNTSTQQDIKDVAYGSNSKQKFNIYLPAGRSEAATPVLFFIHGGAWTVGDRNDFATIIPGLRQLFPTYAFVLVSYRLFDQTTDANKFPAQEQDIKACIEAVLGNSSQYGISKKYALWGQSAGAHLAALYAYKYGSAQPPAALINQSGPMDLLPLYNQLTNPVLKTLLPQLIGNPSSADTLLYHSSSPLRFVTAASPPTLIMHGTTDDIVPYQQAVAIEAKLQQFGVPHVYKLYPNEGHDLAGASEDVTSTLIAFLKQHLN